MMKGFTRSGVYPIYPNSSDNQNKVAALCDMNTDGGGWTIFQHRNLMVAEGLSFDSQSWSDYEDGFGTVTKEYWLGNRVLNLLTSDQLQEMRIEVKDVDGSERHVTYFNVSIDSPQNLYKLKVGAFGTGCSWIPLSDTNSENGLHQINVSTLADCQARCTKISCPGIDWVTAPDIGCWISTSNVIASKQNVTHYTHVCDAPSFIGNILRYNNGQNFSTPDRDNDNNTQLNCGSLYQSGWWHNQCSLTPSVNSDCLSSNLNGRYSADTNTSSFWATWDCTRVYLTGSEMKFRPMQPTDAYQQQVVEADADLSMDSTHGFYSYQGWTTCGKGYSLLSCNAPFIYSGAVIYPITGSCFSVSNNWFIWVQAWCSNSVQGIEYISTTQQTGVVNVSCPAGKKVLGCHMNQTDQFTGNYDDSRQFFPINESSCTCSGSASPTSCIASCASNVINHEIVKVNGSGSLRAICTPGKIALGCGFTQASLQTLNYYQRWYSDTSSSCFCLSYGTEQNCYAVCGNFV